MVQKSDNSVLFSGFVLNYTSFIKYIKGLNLIALHNVPRASIDLKVI